MRCYEGLGGFCLLTVPVSVPRQLPEASGSHLPSQEHQEECFCLASARTGGSHRLCWPDMSLCTDTCSTIIFILFSCEKPTHLFPVAYLPHSVILSLVHVMLWSIANDKYV